MQSAATPPLPHQRPEAARMRDVCETMVRAHNSDYGPARHQIESINKFYTDTLPQIVQENSTIVINCLERRERHVIQFGQTTVPRPQHREASRDMRFITPHEARLRSITYASQVLVNVLHDTFELPAAVSDSDVAQLETHTLRHVGGTLHREVVLCSVPVMVRSIVCCLNDKYTHEQECMQDPGGYFIINGNEKVLISQEKLRTNYAYVFPAKASTRFFLQAEVRSCHETKVRSTSTLCMYLSDTRSGAMPEILVSVPFVQKHLPLAVVFRALDVASTPQEMLAAVVDDVAASEARYGARTVLMARSVLDCEVVDTATIDLDSLYDYIGAEGLMEQDRASRVRAVTHIVTNELFPHIGLDASLETRRRKTLYLGSVVRKLLLVATGVLVCDDRDHYVNKRVDSAGVLLALLFRQRFRAFLKTMQFSLSKQVQRGITHINVIDSVNPKTITAGLKYAFATGNWGVQKGVGASSSQSGVAQVLTRMNWMAMVSNLRRINTPINRDGKNAKPRQLHASHWFIVCPVKTPEGASTGLMKNLATLAHIRTGYDPRFVERRLRVDAARLDIVLADDAYTCAQERSSWTAIQVNGRTFGYVRRGGDAQRVVAHLRALRRCGALPFDVSIVYRSRVGEVAVSTDSGCLLRPVLVLERFHAVYDDIVRSTPLSDLWSALQHGGVIEYIDKEEELELNVASTWPDAEPGVHTHAEIHPSLMFSQTASLIPFPEMNQAPRNMYYASMAAQAVGAYSHNPAARYDAVAHSLWYPQRPLVHTMHEHLSGNDEMPAGQNVIVAILCKLGYNQEDSVILNKASLERGLFRSTKYVTLKDEEKSLGANVERFESPLKRDAVVGKSVADYSLLDGTGLPSVGALLPPTCAIIGKTMATTPVVPMTGGGGGGGGGTTTGGGAAATNVEVRCRDRSVVHKSDEPTRVDAVFVTSNKQMTRQSARLAKVRLRTVRQPLVGDKFASRAGQKGVCGMILPQEDMPFTLQDGMTPDMLINPHCIPSRMTMGHLAETLLGLLGAVRGDYDLCDATAFQGSSVETIGEMLQKSGYARYGKQRMIDGMTGEMMEALVFTGPIYYQRLKHMVADKVHGRTRGPVQILTRQPVEGRSRGGGLRFGEMERDTVISHGASAVTRAMLLYGSDAYETPICGQCGMIAIPPPPAQLGISAGAYCQACQSGDAVRSVTMPYAAKLLVQELAAMNIATRFRLKPAGE